MDRQSRLEKAQLYFICDSRPGGRELTDLLPRALAGGVDLFQLRDKRLSDDELRAQAEVASAICREAGALFIINDRPDLATACGADGVHIGQEDTTIEAARAAVGPDLLIGVSTHSPAQLDAAAGADYAGVGPVHATPTKPGRAAVGLDYVRHAAAHTTLPFFAIGGIDSANVAEVVAAGAQRIAVVRAIADADDPEYAARRLRAAIEDGAINAAA
ncbi:MAG TPA: thiamine phosphate synthase [Baekduia sp.]|nr:thiamine phosphate synthase [Baekduia sp.]